MRYVSLWVSELRTNQFFGMREIQYLIDEYGANANVLRYYILPHVDYNLYQGHKKNSWALNLKTSQKRLGATDKLSIMKVCWLAGDFVTKVCLS